MDYFIVECYRFPSISITPNVFFIAFNQILDKSQEHPLIKFSFVLKNEGN
jgi:hypothetical protein